MPVWRVGSKGELLQGPAGPYAKGIAERELSRGLSETLMFGVGKVSFYGGVCMTCCSKGELLQGPAGPYAKGTAESELFRGLRDFHSRP